MVQCGVPCAALAFLCCSVVTAEAFSSARLSLLRQGRTSMLLGMEPEVAAQAFVDLEDEWLTQATPFLGCDSSIPTAASDSSISVELLQANLSSRTIAAVDCHSVPEAFERSFFTVVRSILHGSSGDSEEAREYLDDVCNQKPISEGWRRNCCQGLAEAINGAMSQDAFGNRQNVDFRELAAGFWFKFLDESKKLGKRQVLSKEEETRIIARANAEEDEMAVGKAEVDESLAEAAAEEAGEEEASAASTTNSEGKAKLGLMVRGKAEGRSNVVQAKAKTKVIKPWPDPWKG